MSNKALRAGFTYADIKLRSVRVLLTKYDKCRLCRIGESIQYEVKMRYSRQNMILELISQNEIETQDKLAAMLKAEGFNVTQATISRDIKELQLIKVLTASGKYKYSVSNRTDAPISNRFVRIFRETVISMVSAKNLMIVKTLPGCGGATAEAIDNLGMRHIVGTVGGDNTVLVIVDDDENVPEISALFNGLIQPRQSEQ